jgi:hypothetical protein
MSVIVIQKHDEVGCAFIANRFKKQYGTDGILSETEKKLSNQPKD